MTDRASERDVHGGPEIETVTLRHIDLQPERWPNDGGWTRQVWASNRPGASWRLSIAEIDRPGAFSRFPRIDRTLVVASDAALHLQVDGILYSAGFAQTVSFSGEATTAATDEGSYPVVVVNLMVGRDDPVEMVVVARDGQVSPAPTVSALALLSGRALLDDCQELNTWDSLVVGRACPSLTFHGAVVAEIHVTTQFTRSKIG